MKKRIISAVIMAIIFIPLFVAGGRPFAITMGVLSLLSLKEMLDLKKSHSKIPNGIIFGAMIILFLLVIYVYQSGELSYGISHRILILMSFIFFIPTLFPFRNGDYETKDAFYLMGLTLFFGTVFNSFLWLRETGVYPLLYVFVITIATDTFAYFTGSFIGRRKIVPNISPNKTLEGYIGGLLMGTIIGSIFHYYLLTSIPLWEVVVMTFFISVMGQVGDLFFSKIKRENEIKDFSNLIPGHGGVLDRLDSAMFAVLAYVLLLRFF